MNTEKLDALASQAGFDVKRLRAPHPGGFPREDMLALESFAELIVRECIDINQQELSFNAFEQLMNRYQKQFGVEL
jgi:hypothetical protein